MRNHLDIMPPSADGDDAHECVCEKWGRMQLTYRACAKLATAYLRPRMWSPIPVPVRQACAECPVGLSAAAKLGMKRRVRPRQVHEQKCH